MPMVTPTTQPEWPPPAVRTPVTDAYVTCLTRAQPHRQEDAQFQEEMGAIISRTIVLQHVHALESGGPWESQPMMATMPELQPP